MRLDHDYIDSADVATRYLEDRLPSAEREAFEAHLVDCDECGDRLLLAQMLAEEARRSADAPEATDGGTEQPGQESGAGPGKATAEIAAPDLEVDVEDVVEVPGEVDVKADPPKPSAKPLQAVIENPEALEPMSRLEPLSGNDAETASVRSAGAESAGSQPEGGQAEDGEPEGMGSHSGDQPSPTEHRSTKPPSAAETESVPSAERILSGNPVASSQDRPLRIHLVTQFKPWQITLILVTCGALLLGILFTVLIVIQRG